MQWEISESLLRTISRKPWIIAERRISYMSRAKKDTEGLIESISELIAEETDEKAEKKLERSIKKGLQTPYARVLLRLAISLLLIASLAIFATGVLKYQELMREKSSLEAERDRIAVEIEELRYLIDCPVDREYIIRVARERLGLNLPDEIVYYNDYNDPQK